jgi:uncharacterized SAM-binding protein YcdF (DUF218 family)
MSTSGGTNFIVVPESLSADEKGRPLGEPSFAYRQVLEYAARTATVEDRVYLAPANSFGGPVTEERAAYQYLVALQPQFELYCPGFNLPALAQTANYVDTWGNAYLLRSVLDIRGKTFELITTHLHAPRARWCFEKAGYVLTRVHRVQYEVEAGHVTRRNFYYRYPLIHRAYESAAFLRDRCKYGWIRTSP